MTKLPTEASSWKSFVVLVEGSVNIWGKPSSVAQRVKDTLLLSAQSPAATDGQLYTVIKRKDLENKGGKDGKSLATSLRQWIKQDRIKGLSKKQKKVAKLPAEPAVDVEDEEKSSVKSSSRETDASSTHPVVERKSEEELAKERQAREMEQVLNVDDLHFEPTEEDSALARAVLSITPEESKPDKVYILSDYPATAEEASYLLPSSSVVDGALDAVIELVGGAHDEPYSIASRTVSRMSQANSVIAPSNSTCSLMLDSASSNHEASAASLPVLSLESINAELSASSSKSGVMDDESLTSSVSKSSLLSSKEVMKEAMAKPFVSGTSFAANDLVTNLKNARACARGPGWKDVTFMELAVVPQHEGQDKSEFLPLTILNKFCRLVQSSAMEKYRFHRFLQGCPHVQIPKARHPVSKALVGIYAKYCESLVPTEGLRSPAIILDSMVGAIELCAEFGEEKAEEKIPDAISSRAQNLFVEEETQPKEDVHVLAVGDEVMTRIAYNFTNAKAAAIAKNIEREYWAKVDTPGGAGRQWMPRWPSLTEVERGLVSTQFHDFHAFTPDRLEHIRAIENFEALMKEADPRSEASWNFNDRKYRRSLPIEVLPQVVGVAISEEPQICVEYAEQEDRLLMALYRETPIGRQCTVTRSAFSCTNLRPTLSDWPTMDVRTRPCIFDVDPEPVQALEQHVKVLFPSDHGIIRVEKTKNDSFSWCTVDKDGQRFGLRKIGKSGCGMYTSFDDGAFVQVSQGPPCPGKPDKLPTIMSSYTSGDALHVQHCSNGMVRMNTPMRSDEIERVILGPGTVVRFMTDGSRQILYAGGNVSILNVEKTQWTDYTFTENGGGLITERPVKPKASKASKKKPKAEPVPSVREDPVEILTDPRTGASILRRPCDGVTVITHTDGTILTCHNDGTNILSQEGGNLVRVESAGFATVKINWESESSAQTHSTGGRVDISRGGKTVRSSTLLPDAAVVLVEYDTRVTSKVNGSIRILKPDGTAIEASDDGSVVWRPWDFDAQQYNRRAKIHQKEEEMQLPPDARQEPDRNIACYMFDVHKGNLRVLDWEYNEFVVSSATNAKACSVSVKLSGEFDPVQAVINSPLTPRLFSLRDGHAVEYMNEAQLKQERKALEKRHRGVFSSVSISGSEQGEGLAAVESKAIPISTPLEQLHLSSKYLVDVLEQSRVADTFESSKRDARYRPPRESPKFLLLDSVLLSEQITKGERRALAEADERYLEWKKDLKSTENRFNVEDYRDQAAKDEERKVQLLIAKERKKLRKQERRKSRKSFSSGQSVSSTSTGVSKYKPRAVTLAYVQQHPINEELKEGDGFEYNEELLGEVEEEERLGDVGVNDLLDEELRREQQEEMDNRPPLPQPRNEPISASGLNYWNGLNQEEEQ